MKFLIFEILLLALTSVSTCRDATRVVQSASEDNSKEKITIYYARVS